MLAEFSGRLRWFRRLALLGTVLAALVIVLGAWVRLTDAGLGCPDWPGCYGHLYPHAEHGAGKAWHEMIHRYVASTLGLTIVTLSILAWMARRSREQPVMPVALLLLVVCLQGALGALTVTLLLRPLIVTAHLFGGLTTLTLLLWLSIAPERRTSQASERGLRQLAVCAAVVLALQICLGGWTSSNYAALACPDFPTCQRSWWPPMDFRGGFVLWRGSSIDYEGGVLANPARMAIHFSHRLGALTTGTLLITLGVLSAWRGRSPRVVGAGVAVSAAVLLQIAIGIAMVHLSFPLPLAVLHNAGAAVLVASLVWLLRALHPWPAAGMVPLRGADHPQ